MSGLDKAPGNALAAYIDPDAFLRMRHEKARADRIAAEAAGVRLGPEATDRAYELVAMGLLYEAHLRGEYLRGLEEARKYKPRGRPSKERSKDVVRADLLLRMKASGYAAASLEGWTSSVVRAEERFVDEGHLERKDCLFAYGADSNSLVQSVSRGLGELSLTAKALVK